MKKFLLPFTFIFYFGCGNDPIAELIESYVCTTDGVLSDLDFKAIEIKETTAITSTDSMIYSFYDSDHFSYSKLTSLKYSPTSDGFVVSIERVDGLPIEDTFKLERIDIFLESTEEYLTKMKELRSDVGSYFGRGSKDYIRMGGDIDKALEEISLYEKAKAYSLMPPGTIIARSFNCTYSIFNPSQQVKQTQTRTFYLDPEFTKVLGASDVLR